MIRPAVWALSVACAVVLMAGCAAGSGGDEDSRLTASPVTPAPRIVPNPQLPPPTAVTSMPTAADGTDVSACADGDCEVVVRSGDVLPLRTGIGPVTVTVRDGRIVLAIGSAAGITGPLFGGPGWSATINGQSLRVLAVRGDQGVLQLRH